MSTVDVWWRNDATALRLYIRNDDDDEAYMKYCKGKVRSPYSITEHRVPEMIPVIGSQPAGDVSHKTGGTLPLLSARPAVTFATFKSAATSFAAWRTKHRV